MTTDGTRAQALLSRVEGETSALTDSLVVAAEAAKALIDSGKVGDVKSTATSLTGFLPANVTVLERGLAIGMVLGLQAENTK